MSYLFGSTNNSAGIWIPDEDRTRRGAQTNGSFFELWPISSISSGDPTSPLALTGADSCNSGRWAEWSAANGGHVSPVFVGDKCVDTGGTGIAGVIVRIFRASDNLYVGQTVSDGNGNYSVATPYAGVAHYCVAYLSGSPDLAGTTVNTLIPA